MPVLYQTVVTVTGIGVGKRRIVLYGGQGVFAGIKSRCISCQYFEAGTRLSGRIYGTVERTAGCLFTSTAK